MSWRLAVVTHRAIGLVALALLFPAAATTQTVGDELLAVTVDIQVIASDHARASEVIAEWAEERGGYFVYRSQERVVIRLPNEHLPELRPMIEQLGNEVVVYNPSTADLRGELRDIDAAIAGRTDSLDRILAYLDDANVSATLAFERELRSLNQEIESYTGRRRAIVNDTAFARVDVRLSMRERAIPGRLPSSFGWINTIDLYRFIDERYNGGFR